MTPQAENHEISQQDLAADLAAELAEITSPPTSSDDAAAYAYAGRNPDVWPHDLAAD